MWKLRFYWMNVFTVSDTSSGHTGLKFEPGVKVASRTGTNTVAITASVLSGFTSNSSRILFVVWAAILQLGFPFFFGASATQSTIQSMFLLGRPENWGGSFLHGACASCYHDAFYPPKNDLALKSARFLSEKIETTKWQYVCFSQNDTYAAMTPCAPCGVTMFSIGELRTFWTFADFARKWSYSLIRRNWIDRNSQEGDLFFEVLTSVRASLAVHIDWP